ncbi:RNA cytidine acetyltransferase-like isoform X2 [Argiope bruennichi]|uniref:RNA cytidine acetyltransferase-like isoform X2 n=1 Tax=Argiope bruennichi TaxID=94029 RepID=UPI002494C7B6|nr:RNA cytidine acetyltransferase-like isoform X2 [Argiope bruennichi]
MTRKKMDLRITKLIKNVIKSHHRSMFFILGENARKQVVFLHHLLVKYRVSVNYPKPSVLWCFKKETEFNIHYLKKRLKLLRKAYCGVNTFCQEYVSDHFLLSSDIQFCHYSETDKILGRTFGMLIIQDFEALTPNILARIIECVEGGGMILFLLQNIATLEDLFLLNMDIHSRWVTEAHNKVNPSFNKRFVLSLKSCENCLILDDTLKVKSLPEIFDATPRLVNKNDIIKQIAEHISSSSFSDNVKKIVEISCTLDQLSSLEKIYETLKLRNSLSVVSLTSARGRGKSSVLGLAICLAVVSRYSNVYVTAPHLENLQTLFKFLLKGLTALGYKEGDNLYVQKSDINFATFITGIKVSGKHPKKVCYLSPTDFHKSGGADLIVIDEAAAIPLPLVKKWIDSCTVLMASTINGYEGTGRSLSLKLLNQLRTQSVAPGTEYPVLHEIQLEEAIRYANGDCVETWLNRLLCLDASMELPCFDCEPPKYMECDLYYVNRDALFSYNKFAEKFLQDVVSLFVSSHYKNSPNDLLMMADAPAHHIFCLLPRESVNSNNLPNVLCAVQVCLEGQISVETSQFEQSEGRRASGDLIPWVISQQFQDVGFCAMSGARVVRIATHPQYQKMGYGKHALHLLSQFYSGTFSTGDENTNSTPSKKKRNSSLLLQLQGLHQEPLDYLGVSYGLTPELFKFWKKSGFAPLYIRQTTSEVTGEHSCIMIKYLKDQSSKDSNWLSDYFSDFSERFASLLLSSFKHMPSSLALSIFHYENLRLQKALTPEQLRWLLSPRSLQRLKAYCLQQVDYHLILDLLPVIARYYFLGYFNGYFLSSIQESVLLCIGMQSKSVDETASELAVEGQQLMGCFRKALKRILQQLDCYRNNSSIDDDVVEEKQLK